MLGASDIDRNERIKALLAQLQGSRGYQSKAIEADRANELSSDLGYNFEKIGRAFSNERPNRADYKSESDNLGRAKAITGGLKEDLAGTYEEALHDPTSAISGASRGIYGGVSGLPAEDLAGASAMQLESLTGPLKVKSSLANAEMLGKINAGKLGMAAKEEERKNKELGLKEQELGLKRSESESKVGKVQADLADQSDPNTPKAKALQDIYLNALKKAGAEIDPAYVRQLPAASVKELLDSHFKIESSKYGIDESTRRAKELLDKKLADEQLTRDAMAAQKEKERLFQGQKAKEGLLSQKQLKSMGITSGEGIAKANRENAIKLKQMEIDARKSLQSEKIKAGVGLPKAGASNIGNKELKQLPEEEQHVVKGLADANAKKIAIANQIDSTIQIMSNPKVSREQAIQQGRQLLKVLNSTEGKDAVGAEEAKRLGSYLEFSLGLNLNSPRAFGSAGLDLPGFIEQSKLTKRSIVDSINQNQAEIQRRYKAYGIDRTPIGIGNKTIDQTIVRDFKKVSPETRAKLLLKAKEYLSSQDPRQVAIGKAFLKKIKGGK